ncbi:DUF2812 domain-containing protein [Paenibacillus oryzisoli]|uniref:DUF2812 domain-containing protein n=1 Tax=Paenibacillus oryzisoli TaxID=1850517 RepID=UPI003D27CF56
MSDIKHVFKWWNAGRCERIERWLEEMELQGWHLDDIDRMGTRFRFKRGEPRKMSYCADFQSRKDPNYIRICEDAGWRQYYFGSGWYIWGTPYEGAKPALFTDNDSLIERNNRLIGLLACVLAAQVPMFIMNWDRPAFLYFLIIYIPVLALIAGTLIQLAAANKRLKSKKNGL